MSPTWYSTEILPCFKGEAKLDQRVQWFCFQSIISYRVFKTTSSGLKKKALEIRQNWQNVNFQFCKERVEIKSNIGSCLLAHPVWENKVLPNKQKVPNLIFENVNSVESKKVKYWLKCHTKQKLKMID